MKVRINKNLGFTLVELLVVIALIGILTIISASSFSTVQKKSRDAQRKMELSSLAKALQAYYNDYGHFPYSIDDPINDPNIKSLLGSEGEFSKNNDVYMKKVPKEKYLNNKPFVYEVSRLGKSYNLFADLENREDSACIKKIGQTTGKYDFIIDGVITDYCYGVASSNTNVGDTTAD